MSIGSLVVLRLQLSEPRTSNFTIFYRLSMSATPIVSLKSFGMNCALHNVSRWISILDLSYVLADEQLTPVCTSVPSLSIIAGAAS